VLEIDFSRSDGDKATRFGGMRIICFCHELQARGRNRDGSNLAAPNQTFVQWYGELAVWLIG
jgi:hypothetical protein